ncbi:MAG: exodeoxyribonuclease VII large subunit [Phycisphaerales bacterium]|jgi:exodeoxyribonuclease VII large subunit|nr:exodeoxyribonuclease VII large subunit [Phycisphaerales bacterium]
MSGNFFDFHAKVNRPIRRPAKTPAPTPPGDAPAPLTITQLTHQIELAIKTQLPERLWIKGELSNYKAHESSGISYFTLKDTANCIDCVMFRREAARLKFTPQPGMELLADGRVSVYGQRGKYQFYANSLQPLGQGALELAFQQLRKKLQEEGLFSPERKRPLPDYPLRVAILTSRATAALQDMLKVLRRYRWLKLMIYHVPVQGDGAGEKIAQALDHLNHHHAQVGGVDVILLGRGGGSLEDLWAFNEEVVARAVALSQIPIISGIGHEVDVSIADLVADYHAHTPTEAARVVARHWESAPKDVSMLQTRLRTGLRRLIQQQQQWLGGIQRHEIFRRPTARLDQLRLSVDDRQRSLSAAMTQRLNQGRWRLRELGLKLDRCRPQSIIVRQRQNIDALSHRMTRAWGSAHDRRTALLHRLDRLLNAVGPQQVLSRGYTITMTKKDRALVRSTTQLKPGDRLLTRFADGQIESTVEDSTQPGLFE